MKINKFTQQKDFHEFINNNHIIQEHVQFENDICSRHANDDDFLLEGYCKVCDKQTNFLVDRLFGSQITEQGWIPNWRERLECQQCRLNNRQRAILHVIKEAVEKKSTNPVIYAMEQVTPLFSCLKQQYENVIGSEYLGEDIESGSVVNNIRHENIEQLSFADQSIDIIVSNDVLEHVNSPEKAIAEIYRVLKPNGEIFMTVPFHANEEKTVCRATLNNGTIKHLLPPVYHGNPISDEGSLVFNDFGWDLLEQMKMIGFQDVSLCNYWSDLYGYLGEIQYYFWAGKSNS
ncbi:class I SAM-dependent methyltransferase [Candidatus Halobeggiatoa sp. HSG11]|nr:class I SAM-dependent methyltransferase [Candidatus Halobeggiatoa sp. HSG11]